MFSIHYNSCITYGKIESHSVLNIRLLQINITGINKILIKIEDRKTFKKIQKFLTMLYILQKWKYYLPIFQK